MYVAVYSSPPPATSAAWPPTVTFGVCMGSSPEKVTVITSPALAILGLALFECTSTAASGRSVRSTTTAPPSVVAVAGRPALPASSAKPDTAMLAGPSVASAVSTAVAVKVLLAPVTVAASPARRTAGGAFKSSEAVSESVRVSPARASLAAGLEAPRRIAVKVGGVKSIVTAVPSVVSATAGAALPIWSTAVTLMATSPAGSSAVTVCVAT